MILNAYAILDAFLSLFRLGLALVVLGLTLAAWRQWRQRRQASGEMRRAFEDRCYLVFLFAVVLLIVNVVSWPLLYLLLQSYVPEWPGVMCIYGVTQVGTGSMGASRHLPALLKALQFIKPALVFCGGAWFSLYLINRRTAMAPLMGRVLISLLGIGGLAALDAVLELGYLAIPKKEEFLSVGCCTAALAEGDPGRFLPSAFISAQLRPFLLLAFFGVNALMVAALLISVHRLKRGGGGVAPAFLALGALLSLLVSGVFLVDVAAPAVLRLPFHHCPYDLVPLAPETIFGIGSFLLGTFAVGWACVTAWFAKCPETAPLLSTSVRKLLVLGVFGYLGAVVMMGLELALA